MSQNAYKNAILPSRLELIYGCSKPNRYARNILFLTHEFQEFILLNLDYIFPT